MCTCAHGGSEAGSIYVGVCVWVCTCAYGGSEAGSIYVGVCVWVCTCAYGGSEAGSIYVDVCVCRCVHVLMEDLKLGVFIMKQKMFKRKRQFDLTS